MSSRARPSTVTRPSASQSSPPGALFCSFCGLRSVPPPRPLCSSASRQRCEPCHHLKTSLHVNRARNAPPPFASPLLLPPLPLEDSPSTGATSSSSSSSLRDEGLGMMMCSVPQDVLGNILLASVTSGACGRRTAPSARSTRGAWRRTASLVCGDGGREYGP